MPSGFWKFHFFLLWCFILRFHWNLTLLLPRWGKLSNKKKSWWKKCKKQKKTLRIRQQYTVNTKRLLYGYLSGFGCESKTGVVRTLFSRIDLCSDTLMNSSCRDLLGYKTEHGSSLKKKPKICSTLFFSRRRSMFSHFNGKLSPRPIELHAWT